MKIILYTIKSEVVFLHQSLWNASLWVLSSFTWISEEGHRQGPLLENVPYPTKQEETK